MSERPEFDAKLLVIGGGLAGCEAAWQAAKRGVKVRLLDMKPEKFTPAHTSTKLCELVCSNSLRSDDTTNAVGLLKEELRRLGSIVMEAAEHSRVPAGTALAVDREVFSSFVTEKLRSHPNIELCCSEASEIPDGGMTIVATGPLTSDSLAKSLGSVVGEGLHFYDAAAPIVDASSIDMTKAFLASRYGKGEASYLNCPMTEEEYGRFYEALITAKTAPLHSFDASPDNPGESSPDNPGEPTVFERCMPVEIMAKRGRDTLRYGPMKPVGLPDPVTGEEYYAVVQLRAENVSASMYNIVGFQTHLTFGEQRRVFGMIPGLENAEYHRYGVMHRNTFLDSPRLLSPDYSLRDRPELFFAGQMTGVEGYVESAASGFAAGVSAADKLRGGDGFVFPRSTEIGALAHYVSDPATLNFQPMNANFGIIEPLGKFRGSKRARCAEYARRSLENIEALKEKLGSDQNEDNT